MRWYDYYEKINYWSVSTAVSKISSLEDMGAPDEIVDALNIIAFEDKQGADKLLNRAIQHGVKFSGDNLVEISGLCAEENFKKALYQSADAFTAQELFWNDEYEASKFIARALEAGVRFRNENLAELTGLCNEDTVKQAALLSGLLLTEESQDELCEEDEEKQEDLSFEIQSAISAADYALGCLAQAQRALNDSENVSFIDMMSKGVFTSVWKYSSLSVADAELQQAQKRIRQAIVQVNKIYKELSKQIQSKTC